MPKRSSKPKKALPKDSNPLAKEIVEATAGADTDVHPPVPAALYDEPDIAPEPPKDPAAVAPGKLGGKKGGAARAKALSAKRRATIEKAAKARWGRTRP